MVTNPFKHVKGGDGACIPLFCTACAFEAGYSVGRALTATTHEYVAVPAEYYYSPAELRWMEHCDRKGRPHHWGPWPLGDLP